MGVVSVGTSLVLLRHGQTDWNAEGRFQGQADIPLNEVGRRQAERAGRALGRLGADAVWCSPLTRTRQTAEPLLRALGLEARTDERLKEIHVGTWEGLSIEDVERERPEFYEGLRAGRDMRRSETGETASETGERCAQALREIAETHAGQRVVVVSHGVALKQGIAAFLGWPWEVSTGLGAFDNCSWAVLEQGRSGWQLVTYNANAEAMATLLEDDPSAEQDEA